MKKKKVVLIVLLILLVVPFPLKYVPEWRIRVVDLSGKPLRNHEVLQRYYFMNFLSPNKEIKQTDKDGYVMYQARWFVCPVILWLPVLVLNMANFMTVGNAPFGSSTIVEQETFVFSRYVNTLSEPPENVMVVRKK